MIDSAVLQMPAGTFKVLDGKCFDGEESKQLNGKFSVTSAFSSQTKIAKKEGYYFPRVILPKVRKGNVTNDTVSSVEIQASLPKVLYDTNALEIDHTDLQRLYFKLVNDLAKIHIRTTTHDLEKAVLKRLDFSKVIRLPPYLGEARQVLKVLDDFNDKPRSDFTRKHFFDVSEGMALKFWNNTQGYVIYDKFGEIIANGYTKMELGLKKEILEKKLKRNVIKFELSLERKQSMEAVLRRFIPDKKKDFTLSDVMQNTDISRSLLLEAFDKVYSPTTTGLVTLGQMEENRLEWYLLEQNWGVKKHALMSYLVNMATKIGVAATWDTLKQRLKGGSYDKYKREVALAIAELGQLTGYTPNLVAYLRNQHQKFAIIRPKSYDDNVKYC